MEMDLRVYTKTVAVALTEVGLLDLFRVMSRLERWNKTDMLLRSLSSPPLRYSRLASSIC